MVKYGLQLTTLLALNENLQIEFVNRNPPQRLVKRSCTNLYSTNKAVYIAYRYISLSFVKLSFTTLVYRLLASIKR